MAADSTMVKNALATERLRQAVEELAGLDVTMALTCCEDGWSVLYIHYPTCGCFTCIEDRKLYRRGPLQPRISRVPGRPTIWQAVEDAADDLADLRQDLAARRETP